MKAFSLCPLRSSGPRRDKTLLAALIGLALLCAPSVMQAQPSETASETASEAPPEVDGPTGGSFTVVDERAPDEVSEVSRLYLNGHLAATFRLTLNHEIDEKTLPIPIGRTDIPYALCGEITIMRNGRPVTHVVSSEGMLHHPDGQRYEAVGDNDFNDFFLVNYDDPTSADHRIGRSTRCTAPTA